MLSVALLAAMANQFDGFFSRITILSNLGSVKSLAQFDPPDLLRPHIKSGVECAVGCVLSGTAGGSNEIVAVLTYIKPRLHSTMRAATDATQSWRGSYLCELNGRVDVSPTSCIIYSRERKRFNKTL